MAAFLPFKMPIPERKDATSSPHWKVKIKSLSRVRLFATPCTVAYKAPPSMGFYRQEYWSGLPFPSPGHLPDPGIEPRSPALQEDTLTSGPPGGPEAGPRASTGSNKHRVRGNARFRGQPGSSMGSRVQARAGPSSRATGGSSSTARAGNSSSISSSTETRGRKILNASLNTNCKERGSFITNSCGNSSDSSSTRPRIRTSSNQSPVQSQL